MIIFDVGAMDGREFSGLTRSHPNIDVYAFEPHPEHFAAIEKRTAEVNNYEVFNYAITDVDRECTLFHIANRPGCSSLHTFDTDYARQYGAESVDRVMVECVRLDTFIRDRELGGELIDYLHIDAQGEDLNVLKSLGDCIDQVTEGCCETSLRPAYKSEPHQRDVLEFLKQSGFNTITKVPQRDGREENVFFAR